MNLPGFTAEAALYRGINLYQMSGVSIHKEEGLYPAYRVPFLAYIDEEDQGPDNPYDPYDPETFAEGVIAGLAIIVLRGFGSLLAGLFGGGGSSCVNPTSCRSDDDCCDNNYCRNNRCVRCNSPAYPCSPLFRNYVPCCPGQHCCLDTCVDKDKACP